MFQKFFALLKSFHSQVQSLNFMKRCSGAQVYTFWRVNLQKWVRMFPLVFEKFSPQNTVLIVKRIGCKYFLNMFSCVWLIHMLMNFKRVMILQHTSEYKYSLSIRVDRRSRTCEKQTNPSNFCSLRGIQERLQ